MKIHWDKIIEAQNNLMNIQAEYLKGRGWVYTSTIGSTWFWVKEINGISAAMTLKDALDVQNRLYER